MAAPRLLAALLMGASVPEVTGDTARLVSVVPDAFLGAYATWIDDHDAASPRVPARADSSGGWSGVLLPAQREAARLLVEFLPLIEVIAPHPGGGYRIALTCELAAHDRLALWGSSLDLLADLFDIPADDDPHPDPITVLEPGVPQEMAGLILDLFGEAPAPETPGSRPVT